MINDKDQIDAYYNENTNMSKEDFDLSFLDDDSSES